MFCFDLFCYQKFNTASVVDSHLNPPNISMDFEIEATDPNGEKTVQQSLMSKLLSAPL